jgi:predicted nucleic acid-binding protein
MLFIYWLEDNPQFAKRVGAIRARMRERDDQLLTGAFTFGEVLAGVYRSRNSTLAVETKRLMQNAVSEVVPFTIETADRYAQIRGSMGLAPADAIHLASAVEARCDLFLTNDKRLVGKFVPGIQFIAALDTTFF